MVGQHVLLLSQHTWRVLTSMVRLTGWKIPWPTPYTSIWKTNFSCDIVFFLPQNSSSLRAWRDVEKNTNGIPAIFFVLFALRQCIMSCMFQSDMSRKYPPTPQQLVVSLLSLWTNNHPAFLVMKTYPYISLPPSNRKPSITLRTPCHRSIPARISQRNWWVAVCNGWAAPLSVSDKFRRVLR